MAGSIPHSALLWQWRSWSWTTTNGSAGRCAHPDSSNDKATDSTTLVPEADIEITKDDGVTTATPGGKVTYAIEVTNNGPSDDPSVWVLDMFPSVLTCVWTSDVTAGELPGTIIHPVALPAGSSVDFEAVCDIDTAATGSTLSNTATATSSVKEADVTNNLATDADTFVGTPATPEADLAIKKTGAPDPVAAGGTLTYTVFVENFGPSSATGVEVVDILPAAVTYVSSTGTCVESPAGTLTCALGTIAKSASKSFNVTVTVGAATAAGTITNIVAVSSSVNDPDTGNNTDTVRTSVGATPSVVLPQPPLVPPPVPDTVGLQDPGTGQWHLRNSAGVVTSFFFGNPVDLALAGDWDGDGDDTVGLYRQFDGFFYLRNSNTAGIADFACFAGNPEDRAVAGDWDGDGDDNLGIYRPSEQKFYLFNKTCTGTPMGAASVVMMFGNPGDLPYAGDFDGDGMDEVGLFRPTTGFVYYRNTLTTGIADRSFFWGDPADRVFSGGRLGRRRGRHSRSVPAVEHHVLPEELEHAGHRRRELRLWRTLLHLPAHLGTLGSGLEGRHRDERERAPPGALSPVLSRSP